MKLNLGSGTKKREGWINCDWSEETNPDMVFDLNDKIPIGDNKVDQIYMSHVLEHFHEPLKILGELHRVCKNGALIEIRVPYFSHESAFSMMDHYSFFTWTTFDALQSSHPCHWQSVGSFVILDKELKWRKPFFFLESMFNLFPRVYQELFCWWFPAKELRIKLEVLK